MKDGPWCFDNDLLALQRWERTKDFSDSSFLGACWKIVGECYTVEVGRIIACKLWGSGDMKFRRGGGGWGAFFPH